MRTLKVGTVVVAVAMIASSTQAAVTATAVETSGDVVFQASGTLNLDAWTFNINQLDFSRIQPSTPIVLVGPTPAVPAAYYISPQNLSRPDDFGSGGSSNATSGSGDMFGFRGTGQLVVPEGYVSGNPLSGTATYVGQTFASLGMDIGTYVWTWGSGASSDSFTLDVGTTAVAQSTWGTIKGLYR